MKVIIPKDITIHSDVYGTIRSSDADRTFNVSVHRRDKGISLMGDTCNEFVLTSYEFRDALRNVKIRVVTENR